MNRTPGSLNGPPVEARHPLDTASGSDLTEAAFIDEFDEQEGRYRVTYDSVQATPSFAVVTVVSNITGRDPMELDPLYESIDSDALDALCAADTSSGFQLTFRYNGCEITVGPDDVVEVMPG